MRINLKLLLISLLFFQIGNAQESGIKFKISSNYLDGAPHFEKEKIIESEKSIVDIYFFKNHFGIFYGLPKVLIKKQLKNKEITEWAYEKTSENIIKNSSDTYKYDSEGRLIEYKYTTCGRCSSFSKGYKLFYDSNNRVIEQQNFSLKKEESKKYVSYYDTNYKLDKLKNWIVLTYDSDGAVIKVEECENNGIRELIELVE